METLVEFKVALIGCGTVGKKFIQLLNEKKNFLMDNYHLRLSIVAVVDTQGAVCDDKGLDLDQLIISKEDKGSVAFYSEKGFFGMTGLEAIKQSNADLIVEAGPTDLKSGEPALSHIEVAFKLGMHVVSLSKGAIVCGYQQLADLASRNGCHFKFSGATAAALPTTDIALNSLAGAKVHSIEGILNGTTNYILSRMYEDEISYPTALEEAQKKGIAEPNSVLDVEGWDTAAKILILANTVMKAGLNIGDILVEGITDLTQEKIKKFKEKGNKIKLIGEAVESNGRVNVSVYPKAFSAEHPLSKVDGAIKGIHFKTDTMGELTVIGGKSDPKSAAAVVLKDIILIAKSC